MSEKDRDKHDWSPSGVQVEDGRHCIREWLSHDFDDGAHVRCEIDDTFAMLTLSTGEQGVTLAFRFDKAVRPGTDWTGIEPDAERALKSVQELQRLESAVRWLRERAEERHEQIVMVGSKS